MGDRPIGWTLASLAGALAAGSAGATVQTKVVQGASLNAVTLDRFDPALGTLLRVDATMSYALSTGYVGFTPPSGFDHAVSGSASFGGLSFGLTGNTVTTDYGNGRGAFAVKAMGSASWSSAADLARLTGGTGSLLGDGQVAAGAPGYASVSPGALLNYKITYTYDDGVAAGAVPEPGTWALMAGGFVLVGAALRTARRRRRGVSEVPTAS